MGPSSFPEIPQLLQLPLLVEVQDPILEVVHLAQDQGLVKDVAEVATLQEGDRLCMKLLFDLGQERELLDIREKTRPLGARQVNYLFPSVQFPSY